MQLNGGVRPRPFLVLSLDVMPQDVRTPADLRAGDIYEDCFYHPCLCVRVDGDDIQGISLVDETFPRSCSLTLCGVRRLTPQEAWAWRISGPEDAELEPQHRWWERRGRDVDRPAV